LAGFTDEDVERIDRELLANKQKNDESKVIEEEPIIIKKIEVDPSIDLLEKEKEQESEEEQILNSVITRLNEI
jgi:CRISPR/Cas system type I-B associated protein Csh2 (Cas7 group RAMP superfamily)